MVQLVVRQRELLEQLHRALRDFEPVLLGKQPVALVPVVVAGQVEGRPGAHTVERTRMRFSVDRHTLSKDSKRQDKRLQQLHVVQAQS